MKSEHFKVNDATSSQQTHQTDNFQSDIWHDMRSGVTPLQAMQVAERHTPMDDLLPKLSFGKTPNSEPFSGDSGSSHSLRLGGSNLGDGNGWIRPHFGEED